jgi:hypothetical protein
VKDRRRLEQLHAALPPVLKSDISWLLEQLRGPLYPAIGVCELIPRFALHEAVGILDELLKSPVSVFLKDAVVEALAGLPGDGTEAILLGALNGGLDASVRANVARALSRFESPRAYHALANASEFDASPAVRKAAAWAMSRLKSQEAVKVFLRRVREEQDPGVALTLVTLAYQGGGEKVLDALREAIGQNPVAQGALAEAVKRQSDARYHALYEAHFFSRGGGLIPFDASRHQRIGITVDLGAGVRLADVVRFLFECAPLDRYRSFFYLRIADEFAADIAAGVPVPRAYDASAGVVPEGVPRNALDGTVFLSFRDPQTLPSGVLGMTEGNKAQVTVVSLVHEFGHAFASLGDEYDSAFASQHPPADPPENLCLREGTPRWKPLADNGFLPVDSPLRREIKDGVDVGKWKVPSSDCFLNNRATDSRYCAVCQLEVIARIAELSGATVPW